MYGAVFFTIVGCFVCYFGENSWWWLFAWFFGGGFFELACRMGCGQEFSGAVGDIASTAIDFSSCDFGGDGGGCSSD